MRFEKLPFKNQIKFLQRMHRKLNKHLFDGELSEVFIDIQNIEDSFAIYFSKDFYRTISIYDKSAIIFSIEALDKIEECKTQNEQKEFIAYLLGHEMIHQYCDEKGIDDNNHSKEWQIEAHKRGILDNYDEEGNLTESGYSFALQILVVNIRII